ncbi:glycosyltransferase [Pseudaminobacter salicylatoxidans]|uniref:glycosyltransferase n=1 Tax=Pseudaminobacter salicylatoxidans TaxID=93369 RepID=UPI0002E4F64C|nr:glycosyltransferase [Pseudaminobacter salicylatoxidans]
MLHVLYLVHDLCDPAVGRRVSMLQAGGARVTLAGFRRRETVPGFDGIVPIDLGVTENRAFGQRLLAVAKAALTLGTKLKRIDRPDVVIGRNLEMLALANRARAMFGADIPIVYECLDIHRLLLGQGGVARSMRGAERFFGRNAALLLTSSPAFVRDYFEAYGQSHAPVLLLQNKMLQLSGADAAFHPTPSPPEGEPWRIGWFGALRCTKSLKLLAEFTRAMDGHFEVVLRGRPAHVEFEDFDGFVVSEPHMRFEGAYRNPQDLPAIYGEVHFSWAIDFFEEGMNSKWLLPNRLYEGCRFGAVPLAMKGTETARFLAERRIGLLLDEPRADRLAALLAGISAPEFEAMREAIAAQGNDTWVCGLAECRGLVERLGHIAGGGYRDVLVEITA